MTPVDEQQTLDLGRPAFVARAPDLAAVPPSPHKCGDCQHLQGNPNPRYMVCTYIRPGHRTRRWPGSGACPRFTPEGADAPR